MKKLLKSLFSFLLKKLDLTENNNAIKPVDWNSSMIEISIWIAIMNACFFGLLFFIGSFVIFSFFFAATLVLKTSLMISLIGFGFGVISLFLKKEKEETTVSIGSVGVILFLGEIYGREKEFYTTPGVFKTGLSVPFFGKLLTITPIAIKYDNVDVPFNTVQASDGELMRGKLSVELEPVNLYTILELGSATKEGFQGRVSEKALELTNSAFGEHQVEEIIRSGNTDGISLLRKAYTKHIDLMTGKGKSFLKVQPLFNGETTTGADCYFPETGFNLRFILQVQTAESKTLMEQFTLTNVAEEKVKTANKEGEAAKIKANFDGKVLEILGNSQAKVKVKDGTAVAKVLKLTVEEIEKTSLKGKITPEALQEAALLLMEKENKDIKEIQFQDAAKIAKEIANGIVSLFQKG